jgi:hypothetical protein
MRLAGSLMEEEDECASPQTSLPEAGVDDLIDVMRLAGSLREELRMHLSTGEEDDTDECGSQARYWKSWMNALIHRPTCRRPVWTIS